MNTNTYKPVPHKKFKKEILQNPKVHQAYEELENEFALIAEMIKTRKMTRKTQHAIAKHRN